MKKRATIFFIACIAGMQLLAQVSFRTIVPSGPLVEGESFRIQYVIEGAQTTGVISPPAFKGFRLVSGPELYTSAPSDKLSVRNEIYTLQPLEEGEYFLQGATAVIDGRNRRSNDVLLKVISAQRATQLRNQHLPKPDNTLYLKPGEDPFEKMRQNLFIKVMVDKTVCFAGQPIVATFKLYSRLQSKSDIIKNPGFYGFTVQDMVSLDDKVVNTETVNGKEFDVHTVRKVQLYPLQAGVYTVDAMEVKNKVEFTRSVVTKKVEQEIIEGVFEEDDADKPMSGVEVFENNISTAAVNITVKSLPSKNKPAEFNGATGRFRVSSSLEQQALTKNQQGFLSIKIEGAGNFSQLLAPVIKWPAGIEGFDPVVIDEWDKQAVPLKGSRIFRYAFVAANPGSYEIPAVSFSFFDPDSNRYRVLNSKAIQLSVSKEARKEALAVEKKVSMQDVNKKASYIAAGVVIIVLIVILVFWAMSDRGKKKPAIEPLPEQSKISVDDALQPAWMLVPAEDKDFYTALNQAIWTWLAQHFNRQGMGLNKQSIRETLLAAGNDPGSVDRLMDIIHHSETAMFTKANMNADKLQIMHDTQILLQSIKA